jgi:SAM-dependent methyltransferase
VIVPPERDAYGAMMLAALEEEADVAEIVERDDGLINASLTGPAMYFAPFRRWPPHHRQAMRFVRGRVLDVGAGAGRVSLHLQERGHEVVAIDNSPGAIAVCRRRGVHEAHLLDFADVDDSLGTFDTVVMLGNNFGVFGSAAKAKRLLRRLRALTSDDARILAESGDVSRRGNGDAPWHVEYRRANVERGRLPGQIRIRIRFRKLVGPWFDYPMVSPAEMQEILDRTGWELEQTIDSDDTYVAVIQKAARGPAARTVRRAMAADATSRASGRRRPRSAHASSRR